MNGDLSLDELCAAEPIRIPGHVQDSGVLIAMGAASFRISQVSANIERFLGLPVDAVLNRGIETVIGAALTEVLKRKLEEPVLAGTSSYLGRLERNSGWFDATAHRHDGVDFVELEPVRTGGDTASRFTFIYNYVQPCLAALQHAVDPMGLCTLAVEQIFALTDFGRVLAYRFDSDGHGEVLAERCKPGYTSYMGHWFPASDIPAQARALYIQNRIRLIADAAQPTSALVPDRNP